MFGPLTIDVVDASDGGAATAHRARRRHRELDAITTFGSGLLGGCLAGRLDA